jgi:uncharacterized protein (TIGR03435 family)
VAADAQPVAPLHFESASIRPVLTNGSFSLGDHNAINSLMSGERLSDGTLVLRSVGIVTLLTLAFPGEGLEDRFRPSQKWIGKQHFELIAKAPPGSGADKVRMMIQSLLVERLHLAVHRELRNQSVATLIVAKGGVKLRPAAGTADAQCKAKTAGWDVQLIQWTCEDVTMAFLSRSLSVFDGTGLDGSYDLSFQWVSPGIMGGEYTVGNGQKALSYGLEKALGLKLETRRQSIPVIFVDHLDSP